MKPWTLQEVVLLGLCCFVLGFALAWATGIASSGISLQRAVGTCYEGERCVYVVVNTEGR